MLEIRLDDHEADQVDRLLDELLGSYQGAEDPDFLRDAGFHAQSLPAALRRELLRFRLLEHEPIAVVRGFRVDQQAIGPTPRHWDDPQARVRSRREDFYLVLCCHVLGDAVAWATEQGGRLVHQVLPIQGNDGGQLGTSTDPLEWHTEDAFHPERMDYVALLSLRNDDGVATTYASVNDLGLSDRTKDTLARPAYPFQPDEGNRADRDLPPDRTGLVATLIRTSHERVRLMYEQPDRVPALFGGPSHPYLRVHPYYIAPIDEPPARDAFDELKAAVGRSLRDVVLDAGNLLFIDNFTAVHGRREIPGHFDGSDRWLKRAFIVRDLRKTRSLRVSAEDRVVY